MIFLKHLCLRVQLIQTYTEVKLAYLGKSYIEHIRFGLHDGQFKRISLQSIGLDLKGLVANISCRRNWVIQKNND